MSRNHKYFKDLYRRIFSKQFYASNMLMKYNFVLFFICWKEFMFSLEDNMFFLKIME